MGLSIDFEDGQTPLDEDEKEGLLIQTIATRGELDEFEQQGIESAIEWTLQKKFKHSTILTELFIREVHKRMYSEVWAWAGEFRKTNKNIGVDNSQVQMELKKLLDDTKYWIDNNSFDSDEIAIRFKHRIVSIHCFANGNGRHSRLMADILIQHVFNKPVFSWGATNLTRQSNIRDIYLLAVREADEGNYEPLIEFARS